MFEITYLTKNLSCEAISLAKRVQCAWGFWFTFADAIKVVGNKDNIETVKAVFETVDAHPVSFQVLC